MAMETVDAGFHRPPCHLWAVSGTPSFFLDAQEAGGPWAGALALVKADDYR